MLARVWVIGVVLVGGCTAVPPPPALVFGDLPDSAITTDAPGGFTDFCLRFPRQCRATPNAPSALPLTESNWRRLYFVNGAVNRDIKPATDTVHYSKPEFWTIPTDGFGDCEDYALTKRKNLLRAGMPASVLRLAVVDTPKEGRHAVLTVSTDEGDFVLDNLTDQILPWNATGYTWISAQSHSDPMRWDALRGTSDGGLATATQPVATDKNASQP